MRKLISGVGAVALATSLTLGLAGWPAPASAAPAGRDGAGVKIGDTAARTATSGATEFSSQRRRAPRAYRGNNAAALGAVTAIFGTIATIAAADAYRDRYYYAPYGYAPAPVYYGPRPYYGAPRYYAPPRRYYAPPRYHAPRPHYYRQQGHWLFR
ncbi:MAG TPA: hypothetical protein VNQ99_03280 [Xanthobacteraceae bacterium]|nr:hypothetical protein [Xanthobacteraceae bacterium]